ncbi:type II toxin-antitoxin system mRNA interferase toxin, RelE/StbE family [Candidatus Roizmanbacteria bacterium CG_4_9_14_0_2_um_filter_39_13]|uniref:Type II toxin-antitoxin system mRNA interferase toxin, RelE/StbE family n=2 Tax=Candidatus Roizmaniibacteriota TaxID=1752723 RepID=A0A2M8EY37_9BACT|nr:MAG: type II toxin-antitoxin system mRNA interferase toxin, RelE/StbE family [Candidatus Roizmanbacteria bacterium CG_4_10_14_0_2_um_filter_39_12]PJC31111.1 MAG: type II toxin-antitoxin system mRNA interferase toxin, RelE/StbE family [Candidatus Roizmanbacteria bacterium CG_4_9_14_0_2_um_filter_39_13]PJE61440.1 MAG: type II toxin-antitoxin system mRNA interferase toxin, RelE/StbE family [Candidatus Roizmanbacteria bacterium CG10_big_fil_rev_8_21_14_0_10_39_12]
MKIKLHKVFVKHFDKRIKPNSNLLNQFQLRLQTFMSDTSHPILHDHKLSGQKQNYRAFSITGDIRVVYIIKGNTAHFLDIGSHNQVY